MKNSLDSTMVFCIINVQCSYDVVVRTFNTLKRYGLTTRTNLLQTKESEIETVLRMSGYRFPATKARALKHFGSNTIDLHTASREELIKSVKGVGPKLASLFLREARGHDVAVMDIHTRRYLYETIGKKFGSLSYNEEEIEFKKLARSKGSTTRDLDLKVWNGNRK